MPSFFDFWLLQNRGRLAGVLLRRWGIARVGNQTTASAAEALAREVVTRDSQRGFAIQKLRGFESDGARATVCRVWVESRHPELQQLLREEGWTADTPDKARVLCLLNLGRGTEAASCSSSALPVLIAESRDESSTLRQAARHALVQVDDDAAVGRLVRCWIEDRGADLRQLIAEREVLPESMVDARVYAALLTGRREAITSMTPKVLTPLVAALHDEDSAVREQARLAVGELSDARTRGEVANKVCKEWVECRAPELEELIVAEQLLAKRPPKARVLSALKLGRPEKVKAAGADVVPPLLEALDDPDPVIAEAAPAVLRSLSRDSARNALCLEAMYAADGAGNPAAEAAAREAGLLPEGDGDRAGWLFLTEQWQRYDELDFERNLLRSFYAAAPRLLQERITAKIRRSGRTEYLTVVGGGDYRSRAAEMREDEAAFMVGMLIQNRERRKLWKLVFELSLAQSVRSLQALAELDWRPEAQDDRAVYERLLGLIGRGVEFSPEAASRWIPPAVRRATAHVKGRVNDLAMSPSRPLIAIGTNDRRAALWNFQTGEIEDSWRYQKVVGRVAFTADDHFVCSEGKASGYPSTLRVYADGNVRELEHPDMITGLQPAGDSRLLISRRDETVMLFDAETGQVLGETAYDFWCRDVCVSPDGERALLLHEGLSLVELPGLGLMSESNRYLRNSVLKCAAFAPGGKEYVIGTHNGRVIVADEDHKGELRISRRNLFFYDQVAGIACQERSKMIIAADMGRHIDFYDWERRGNLGRLNVGKSWRITSLHVSPNGDFLSVGHRDDTMSFWDLRISDIPRMFASPFASAAPRQLGAVQALKQQNPHAELAPALDYLECVLQYRFRYDIEIDELQSIRLGEFDIEIGELEGKARERTVSS